MHCSRNIPIFNHPQAAKRSKTGQQKSLLNFFKPQNPPKVEVACQENSNVPTKEETQIVDEINPEKRVQVRMNGVFKAQFLLGTL
jgi:hypothetical protein